MEGFRWSRAGRGDPVRPARTAAALLLGGLSLLSLGGCGRHPDTSAGVAAARDLSPRQAMEQVCIACHNRHVMQAALNLEGFDVQRPERSPEIAEKIVTKLRAGQMPPREMRLSEASASRLAATLEAGLDRSRRAHPGLVGSRPFQRVNREDYRRIVAAVFGLQIDPSNWLPEDRISGSFDNVADVQAISPTELTGYLNAASDIARLALGQPDSPRTSRIYSNAPTLSQHEWDHVEGTPYGTRGGMSVLHNFPADGEYVLSLRFRLGFASRMHDIDISVDGERVGLLQYGGDIDYQGAKEIPIQSRRIFVKAGQRRLAVAFIRQTDGPYEDLMQPNERSLSGIAVSYGTTAPPHLMHVSVEGPYRPRGVSENDVRRRILSCRPGTPQEELPCARSIVTRLAEGAYGRPLSQPQLAALMGYYEAGSDAGGFEAGIRAAIEGILASPDFLFRFETKPAQPDPGKPFLLSDIDLARRLSFFLWGSNPDAALLRLAAAGKLSDPRVLRAQAGRMLDDRRSENLSRRFAYLWLRLQDLERIEPDEYLYPNFSEQLRQSMRRETELLFDHLVRENRSLLDLYRADYTYIDERLARHYGIPGVYGEHFRRVQYPFAYRRGILGHGSILTLTSLGNRTSPVLRGVWVLEVLMGTPPPPPPPGIPDLEETSAVGEQGVLTTRKRLEKHRRDPVCAACHNVIDPAGLVLDVFDVTGQRRVRENGAMVETSSTFWDGTSLAVPTDLTRALLARPEALARQFTTKLLSYALGRRAEYFDAPVVRSIVRAAGEDYRMRELILGVVLSDPFRMAVEEPGTERAEPEQHLAATAGPRIVARLSR